MSRRTTGDLAAAEFARTAHGLLAMRAFPDEREPWLFVTDRGTFARRTDKGMWSEDWEPVHRWEITRSEFLAAQEAFTRRGEQPSRLALEDFAHRLGRSIVPDPKPELPTEPGSVVKSQSGTIWVLGRNGHWWSEGQSIDPVWFEGVDWEVVA